MEYITFKDWVQSCINKSAESGSGWLWTLNQYKQDYEIYLDINVKPHNLKLYRQILEDMEKIKRLSEVGVNINPLLNMVMVRENNKVWKRNGFID